MKFPQWITKRPAHYQASARLRFIIGTLALDVSGEGSVSALARAVGVDRTLIHKYIDAGAFSVSCAHRIVQALPGRVTIEQLVRPMEIVPE